MNTMADGARERLVAQIGEALFGQPGLTLMELAEMVKSSQSCNFGQNSALLNIIRQCEWAENHKRMTDYWRPQFAVIRHAAQAALAARQPVCGTCRETIQPDAMTGTACACSRQPVGEPVTVEAVATVRRWATGDCYIDWLTEGGIADLKVGDVLMVSDRAITDEDGSGEVYAAPPAQAVGLGQFRAAVYEARCSHEAMERKAEMQECDRLLDLIDSRDSRNG